MEIKLLGIGKQYRYVWIFRHITETMRPGERWAILGPNGAGKSTLIKVLGGFLTPSEGQVEYLEDHKKLEEATLSINFSAPYVDLLEELTTREMCTFHAARRPWQVGLDTEQVMRIGHFENHADKQLRYFSTGMKQRLKVTLALCTESSAVLMDEPCSNFDQRYRDWYHDLVQTYLCGRLLVVASNDPWDYAFCDRVMQVG